MMTHAARIASHFASPTTLVSGGGMTLHQFCFIAFARITECQTCECCWVAEFCDGSRITITPAGWTVGGRESN